MLASGGHEEQRHGYRRMQSGELQMTPAMQKLTKFLQHYQPGQGKYGAAHYCCTTNGSEEAAAGCVVGEPCCADPQKDGPKKAAKAWSEFAFSRTWLQPADGKWTNTTLNCKRLLLIVEWLADILGAMCAKENLKEQHLQKLEEDVARNKENLAARSKLTLLRCSLNFSDTTAKARHAVYVTVAMIMDAIIYAVFGCEAEGRPEITVMELVDPDLGSPVFQALHKLSLLLDDFSLENEQWCLLVAVGVSFDDPVVRDFARREIWGARLGLLDHFERCGSATSHTFSHGRPTKML